MFSNIFYISVIVVVTITIIISSIGIVLAIKFQKKQNNKLKEIEKIVNKNKDMLFQVKDTLSAEDINKIDSTINMNELMKKLYQTYLTFERKMNKLDDNIDDILIGDFKRFYISKIKQFKKNSYTDIKDDIQLIGYAITEFSKKNLKFRININCFNYKTINGEIVSGSNTAKVEQIILLSYMKVDDKWLIRSYENLYEKKLSN